MVPGRGGPGLFPDLNSCWDAAAVTWNSDYHHDVLQTKKSLSVCPAPSGFGCRWVGFGFGIGFWVEFWVRVLDKFLGLGSVRPLRLGLGFFSLMIF